MIRNWKTLYAELRDAVCSPSWAPRDDPKAVVELAGWLRANQSVIHSQRRRLRNPQDAFKPYIVKRPDGGCQVLFPLSELDRLLHDAGLDEGREG